MHGNMNVKSRFPINSRFTGYTRIFTFSNWCSVKQMKHHNPLKPVTSDTRLGVPRLQSAGFPNRPKCSPQTFREHHHGHAEISRTVPLRNRWGQCGRCGERRHTYIQQNVPPKLRRYMMEVRGELSYLAPLGSENISAPYFKQCFFQWGGGYYPPDWVKHHASRSQDRNNKYFILYIEFCINNKI